MLFGLQKKSGSAVRRLQFETLESRQMLAFGVTIGVAPTGQQTYVIDNGADLKFSVLSSGNLTSTIHLGDVTSVEYKGQEMLASYWDTSRYSHYESGLSGLTNVSYTIGGDDEWILVTADDSTYGVVQYYAVRNGDDNIYMASYVTSGAQGRFLAYLDDDVFTNIEEASNISNNVGVVEGSDVFVDADGTTRSKFYNDRRMIENIQHGVTGGTRGSTVGAWMFMGNREHGAQGPFHKIIDFQTTGGAVEIYNVLFSSGHASIEPVRYGLMGPYSLQFNDGSTPAEPGCSWMAELDLQGWISDSERGAVSGIATGMTSGNETVIGLRNSEAQYWAIADPATGAFSIDGVQAGTYEMTLYDQELEVGFRTVTVVAEENLVVDISNTYFTPGATWRIGEWDGTPGDFQNADQIWTMHPSDVRMAWGDSVFVVGADSTLDWQLAQFRDVNNSQVIEFTLTAAEAAAAQTLRIGLTLGTNGGRNRIYVNEGETYAWTSGIPNASAQVGGRSITRGTYRGFNQEYTYDIPASALTAGTNTIRLEVVSGSGGTGFLSPAVVYDAIDLVPTATLANAPRLETITLSPSNANVDAGGQVNFVASGLDQFENPIAANIEFTTTAGTIDQTGQYTAPAMSSTATVTARSGDIVAESLVIALGDEPVVVDPATATPAMTTTGTVDLSVLGDDDGGEVNLTYTWSVIGTPPGSVDFSANGANADKNTTVTLGGDGVYSLRVTLQDTDGNTATSNVTVQRGECIARYRADETGGMTLADSSGGGQHADLTGSYGFVAGRSNNALNLTGGHAELPTGVVSELDDFTIATWVNLSSLDTWARIFDSGDDTTNYMFLTSAGPAGGPRFGIRTPSIGEQIVESSVAIPTNAWTHIAITLSGNTARLYVNGVQRGVSSGVTLDPSDLGLTTANYLGKSQWADPALNGSLDDFRIYARALSGGEVSAMANTTLPSAVTDLTAAPAGASQIYLAWSSVGRGTTYNVFRSTTSGGPFSWVASVSTAGFQDTNLEGSVTGAYYYKVTSENAGGDGPLSNEASATVAPPIPDAAVNLSVEPAVSAELVLSWDAAPNAASYTILRSEQPEGPYVEVDSGVTATTYTDAGLTNHVSYYYVVRSVNVSGSADSVEAAGVPTDLHTFLQLNETTGLTASDSSGHENHGTLVNGASWSSAGKLDSAVALGVANDHVDLPDGFLAGVDEVTVSAWVNLDSVSDWSRIFDFGSGADANMFLTPRNGSTQRLRFAITTTGGGGEQQISTNYTFPTGVWTHVAVTLNGSVGVLYANGVEVGRNNAMTLLPSSLGETTQNYIGRSQYADPYLEGHVDDFRIYSRALDASEIQAVATPPALLGDYNRDDVVDAADYTVWRDNLGSVVLPYSSADGDGNGHVGLEDYAVWRSNFGATLAMQAASIAPALPVDGALEEGEVAASTTVTRFDAWSVFGEQANSSDQARASYAPVARGALAAHDPNATTIALLVADSLAASRRALDASSASSDALSVLKSKDGDEAKANDDLAIDQAFEMLSDRASQD